MFEIKRNASPVFENALQTERLVLWALADKLSKSRLSLTAFNETKKTGGYLS